MNIDNEVYFAYGLRAKDINFDNRQGLIDAFYRRIVDYYITPTKMLISHQHAFAAGVLVSALIDAIGTYSIAKDDRIKELLKSLEYPKDTKVDAIPKFAKEFDDNFRNGLIHEGRIKAGGQFAFRDGPLFMYENNFLIVDPSVLLTLVSNYFEKYIEKLHSSEPDFIVFQKKIKRLFDSEIQAIKRA